MMKAPAAPSGLVRMNLTTSSPAVRRGLSVVAAVVWATSMRVAIALPVPDAWIEPRVGEIDEQVDDHEGERDEEHERLHDRVVAVGHRVHHETADAIEGEHRLG